MTTQQTASVPSVTLNDGNTMPQLGYGVFLVPPPDAAGYVQTAIDVGYRSIDTAMVYRNERTTGQGIADSGISRDELFVTTKLWNTDQGYDTTLEAFETSMTLLGLERLDLYLIHWPAPMTKGDAYIDTWRALVKLREQGRVTSIGVSNFQPEHIEACIEATGVVPVVNQIELHPYFQQEDLRAFHAQHDIVTEAWSPLGQAGPVLSDDVLVGIAASHDKSVAQVVLRWHMQLGNVTIPKTVNADRMRENLAIFDFEISADEMQQIAGLDAKDGRIGPHPSEATF